MIIYICLKIFKAKKLRHSELDSESHSIANLMR